MPQHTRNALDASKPFGVSWDTSITMGGNKVVPSHYTEIETSLPAVPHDSIAKCTFHFIPGYGLTQVTAESPSIKSDPNGTKTMQLFASLKAELEAILGKGDEVDTVKDSSAWIPWMEGMKNGDRVKHVLWSSESSSTLPGEVDSVLLFVFALNHSTAQICLEYTGKNHRERIDYELKYFEDKFKEKVDQQKLQSWVNGMTTTGVVLAVLFMILIGLVRTQNCSQQSADKSFVQTVSLLLTNRFTL